MYVVWIAESEDSNNNKKKFSFSETNEKVSYFLSQINGRLFCYNLERNSQFSLLDTSKMVFIFQNNSRKASSRFGIPLALN